jgi:asparagine synthase (glutamine-hydrolysing)
MCGICGYTRHKRNIPENIVEKMKAVMSQRGPDDNGTYADDGVVFGHRRLSIIDLRNGRQPITNEDGTVVVVANGEIYNYRELQQTLKEMGHTFHTRCDTETLVHLYEAYGEGMVDHLVGMFAFAIWDSRDKTLLIARDRYGQKPVYYTLKKGQLVFASNLESLTMHPDVRKKIDKKALSKYLAFEYVPAPYSIYEDIFKLDAGSVLTWKKGKMTIKKYWNYPIHRSNFPGSFRESCDELIRLMDLSVKRRLVSDVPLGVFLSGGIDSSIIVAMISRHVPAHRIKTFSIGFREPSFDESSFARKVAGHFGTDHHEEILDVKALIGMLPDAVRAFDEPFADASSIPTFMLSRFARRYVTVALGGDGGDELFAGYDPFVAHRLAGIFLPFPRTLRKELPIRILDRILPLSDGNMSFEFRVKRFFKYLCKDPVLRNHLWMGSFNAVLQRRLFTPEFVKDLEDPFATMIEGNGNLHRLSDLEAVTYDYIRTYLQEDILTKVDRASMAHSLEVRAPFLDHELGEFVASLPINWKLKGLTTKYILKKASSTYLPDIILQRKKKGFGIPKAKWLRQDLRPLLLDIFNRKAVESSGLFSYPFIENMIKEHTSSTQDHQKELWTLLMFEMWRRENNPE